MSYKLEPRICNLFKFIKKGYFLRELFFKGISLKLLSKIFSFVRYDFYFRGRGVDIDYRCIIGGARYISLGDNVWLQRGAMLNVPLIWMSNVEQRPYLVIEEGCIITHNANISAGNKIYIGKNVLIGQNVSILDNRHRYEDTTMPVLRQGILNKGEIIIEDNVWVGANAFIYTATRRIVIGRNSVIAANSVVRKDVGPFTVVSGNPAKVIKRYNENKGLWEPV